MGPLAQLIFLGTTSGDQWQIEHMHIHRIIHTIEIRKDSKRADSDRRRQPHSR